MLLQPTAKENTMGAIHLSMKLDERERQESEGRVVMRGGGTG